MIEYELMYIVPTTVTEEGVGAVEANVGAILAKAGASVLKTVRLGKFRLAYPIRHNQHGHCSCDSRRALGHRVRKRGAAAGTEPDFAPLDAQGR